MRDSEFLLCVVIAFIALWTLDIVMGLKDPNYEPVQYHERISP